MARFNLGHDDGRNINIVASFLSGSDIYNNNRGK